MPASFVNGRPPGRRTGARAQASAHLLRVALVASVLFTQLYGSVAADATEQGCTCLAHYEVDPGTCSADGGRTYAGCMSVPCDGHTGGAVRGFASWCRVEAGCAGAHGGGATLAQTQKWDYCSPAVSARAVVMVQRVRRAVEPIPNSLQHLKDMVMHWTGNPNNPAHWGPFDTTRWGEIWDWDVSKVTYANHALLVWFDCTCFLDWNPIYSIEKRNPKPSQVNVEVNLAPCIVLHFCIPNI